MQLIRILNAEAQKNLKIFDLIDNFFNKMLCYLAKSKAKNFYGVHLTCFLDAGFKANWVF